MENSFVKLNVMYPVVSKDDWKQYISLLSSRNVIYDAKVRQADFQEHWGPLSIKCAFNGKEHYYSKSFHYTVDDSSYLVLNEGKIYGSFIDSETDVESFTIHYKPEFAQGCIDSFLAKSEELMDDPFERVEHPLYFSERPRAHGGEVTKILLAIRTLTNEDPFSNAERLDELNFLLLYHLVLQQLGLNGSGDDIQALRASTRTELIKRLNISKSFILDNYKNNISLDDIASVAFLNKFHFLRLFQRTYGTTPHQFIIQLRLQNACALMKNTRHSITEVCNEVGFSDLASFCKLFKKYYKFSPKEFQFHFNK